MFPAMVNITKTPVVFVHRCKVCGLPCAPIFFGQRKLQIFRTKPWASLAEHLKEEEVFLVVPLGSIARTRCILDQFRLLSRCTLWSAGLCCLPDCEHHISVYGVVVSNPQGLPDQTLRLLYLISHPGGLHSARGSSAGASPQALAHRQCTATRIWTTFLPAR